MLRVTIPPLCLTLLLCPLLGCDPVEPVELEDVAETSGETGFLWPEDDLDEVAPPSSEAVCGPGRWYYTKTTPGCSTCFDPVLQSYVQKFDYFQRWCWDGPPSCGGCGPWQYYGWACFEGCE